MIRGVFVIPFVVLLAVDPLTERAPTLVVRPQDQTVANNGIANFYCSAIGDPKPQIEWWKNRKRLNTTHRFTVIQTPDGGSVLRIDPVHKSRDEAKYGCFAKNYKGEVLTTFHLTVRDDTNLPFGFPRIVQHPRSEMACTGQNAEFVCRVTGIPTPIVTWLKDTVPLNTSSSHHSIIEDGHANTTDFTLRINGIEKRDDGMYECVAENSLGRVHSNTAYLNVDIESSRCKYVKQLIVAVQNWPHRQQASKLVVRPKNQTVANNGIANFYCSARGDPTPQIEWWKNRKRLNTTHGFTMIQTLDGGSVLRIDPVLKSRDEVRYECIAKNHYGSGHGIFYLSVHDENELPVGFPQIVEHPHDKWVTKGYKVVFACQATGNPPSTITWLKNMVPVDMSDQRNATLDQGFLEIVKTDIDDEGKYECVAENSLGTVHSNVAALFVDVLVTPENPLGRPPVLRHNRVPENVFARPLSSTTVVVRWDQTNEEEVMGYDVYFTSNSDGQYSSDWIEQTVDDGRLTTIGGLEPNTVYTIKVQEIFKDGFSRSPSDSVRVKTQLGIPNPPTKLHVVDTSHTSVTLAWVRPAVSEDAIVGYELYWSDVITKEIQNRSIPVRESYVLDDLHPDTEYDFWVAAKSKYHEGPPTFRVRAWTKEFPNPDAPGALELAVIDSTAIRVQWEAPNFPTTFIRGYQIRVAATDEPEHLDFDNIDAAAQEFNVTGLQPETVYSVKIAARIRSSIGRWSASEMVTTPGGVPSRPSMSVRVIPEEPSFTVNVEWTKPNVTHGSLLGYRLRYGNTGTMELGKDEQNKTLQLPQMNTIYQIRLAARNDVGYGGEAVARVQTPIEVPTAPPENLTFYFQTPSTLVVSWEPPSTDRSNGPIISYNAQLRWSDQIKISLSRKFKTVFVDLKENTVYLLRVRAVTRKGGGPYTEIVVIHTPTSPADVPVPSWVQAVPTSKSTAQVWWDNVDHGAKVLGYRVYYKRVYNYDSNEVEWMYVDVNSKDPAELTNLTFRFRYVVVVAARTSNATGKASGKFIFEIRPDQMPISLRAHTSKNSATLTWSPNRWFFPREYRISYEATKEFVDQSGILQKQIIPTQVKTVGSAIRSYTINGLSPFTTYHVRVTAVPSDGSYMPPVRIAVTTRMAAPNPMVKPDFNVVNGTVILPSASEEFGPIAHYDLVVVLEYTEEELILGSESSFDRAFKDPDQYIEEELISGSKPPFAPAFIAARFVGRSIPSVFTIGDGEMYGGFKNRHLISGQRFRAFVRAVVDAPQGNLHTSSPFSDTILHFNTI